MLRVFSARVDCTFRSSFFSKHVQTRATMDARTTAAARATALVVCQANAAAVEQCAQLRRAVLGAQAAIQAGDRGLALRLLAEALGEGPPPDVPRRGARQTCSMCGQRVRTVYWMPATGRWQNLPQRQRQLCTPCYNMRP